MKHMAFARSYTRQLCTTQDPKDFEEHMYKCTAGKTTIGYGLNLEAGLSLRNEAAEMLR